MRKALANLLLSTIAVAAISASAAENRVALVIGNAGYPGPAALRNPANDATDIAAKLKTLGFDVTLKTDTPLRQMLRSLTDFGDKVTEGSEALFFYAGHGMQVRGRNYLIPVDAEIRTESSVSSEAVDVDQLLDKLSRARLSMVILDACRNNPFERRFRGGGQGLAQINAPTGTLIAYATAPGKVAADGDGRNGLYTSELLKAIDIGGIKVEDVFKRVRANVVSKSGEAQTPWESSSLTGDFYFAGRVAQPKGGTAPASVAVPTMETSSAMIELAFWDSIKSSRNVEDFSAYLNKYPNGNFVTLANNRIADIAAEKSGPRSSQGGPDGVWRGQLETYGGLFNSPVRADVKLSVSKGEIDGGVFMYGENRKFSGHVDSTGKLLDAKLVGASQNYSLSGTLSQAHGEGQLGWKLKMQLIRDE
ncbi:MAG: caspase domain-containing protein [Sulfuritalea sp.]|nr:caspase domain-containing protein [Sulfuritalea sp.]